MNRDWFPNLISFRSGVALIVILSAIFSAVTPLGAHPLQPAAPDSRGTAEESHGDDPSYTRRASTGGQSPLQSTFVNDEPLEGGARMLTISTTPLNYQAEDGAWLPIDPRFSAAEGGFTNFTNALSISAGERVAALNLRNGPTRIQWQPLELVLTAANGAQTSLASVLDPLAAAPGELAADSRTVRYAASWSAAGLVEEITAGPGVVEQRLIVESALRSTLAAAQGDTLSLVASLRLPPEAVLYAEGAIQSGAFSTAGRVEVRVDGKTALALDPILAYEQNDPAARVAGSYHFAPLGGGDGRWSANPVAWWAAAERQYRWCSTLP
jgi:hypothetical protein